MKIKCNKSVLLKALRIVEPSLPTKMFIESANGFLLVVTNDDITVTTTNMEISISTTIKGTVKGCTIEEPGKIVVPRRLLDIVRELRSETVCINATEKNVMITAGYSKFELPCQLSSDYPVVPLIRNFPNSIPLDLLKQMLRKTFYAVSSEATKQTMNGILFETENNGFSMVATDGIRMSVVQDAVKNKNNVDSVGIIPGNSVIGLLKVIESETVSDSHVSFAINENQIAFKTDNVYFISRIIQGEFPKYKNVIPKDISEEIVINREDFLSVIKQVSLLAGSSKKIKLHFKDQNLTVTSDTEGNKGESCIETRGIKKEKTICFNYEFLLDIIKGITDSKVIIKLSDTSHAVLITSTKVDEYIETYIVMPMTE